MGDLAVRMLFYLVPECSTHDDLHAKVRAPRSSSSHQTNCNDETDKKNTTLLLLVTCLSVEKTDLTCNAQVITTYFR